MRNDMRPADKKNGECEGMSRGWFQYSTDSLVDTWYQVVLLCSTPERTG